MMPATSRCSAGVERRLDARRPRLAPAAASTISTKCGARNGDAVRVKRQPLGARLARAARATARRPPAMRRSTSRCRASAASRLRYGLKPDGRCGRPARNAACAGVSIDGSRPKYARLARSGADDLVAVRREVQVEREDLALREPMLEPEREHRLAAPCRATPRAAVGRRAGSAAAWRPAA